MRTTNFGFSSMGLKSGIASACAVVLIVVTSAIAGCASSESEDPSSRSEDPPSVSENPSSRNAGQGRLTRQELAEILAERASFFSEDCNERGELTRSECSEGSFRYVCQSEMAREGWSAADEQQCRNEVRRMTQILVEEGWL